MREEENVLYRLDSQSEQAALVVAGIRPSDPVTVYVRAEGNYKFGGDYVYVGVDRRHLSPAKLNFAKKSLAEIDDTFYQAALLEPGVVLGRASSGSEGEAASLDIVCGVEGCEVR